MSGRFSLIDPAEALTLIQQNACVVDIRDAHSYATGHITSAVPLSNDNLQAFLQSQPRQTPMIVCCYHGNSSRGAAEFLAEQGFAECYSLNGGFSLWSQLYPEHCSAGNAS